MLVVSLIAFLGRMGMFWVLAAASLAIVMAVIAFVIAVRGPGGST